MGVMGRPPKPTVLKALAGTLQKCRVNPDEWKPPVGELEEPQGLDEMALRLWREKVRILTDSGVLTIVDDVIFEAWCRAVATARAADAVVAREGFTVPTQAGVTTHPCVRIARASWDAAHRMGASLGLDPSSRARLRGPSKSEDTTVGDFLSGKVRSLAVK